MDKKEDGKCYILVETEYSPIGNYDNYIAVYLSLEHARKEMKRVESNSISRLTGSTVSYAIHASDLVPEKQYSQEVK